MLRYLIIVILAIRVVCAPPPPPAPAPTPAPAQAYIISLQWPISVCATERCKDGIPDPLPEAFRLHGIWPTAPGWNSKLEYCKGGDEFTGNQVDDIRGLVTFWPSYYFQKEKDFWKHEWDKHGKCSGMPLREYFSEAVQLTKLHSPQLLSVLFKSQIRPGPYKVTTANDIVNAIYNHLGVWPQLSCGLTGARTNETTFWLREIHLCTDQTFRIQSCPYNSRFSRCGSYPESTKIKFPNN